MPQFGVKSRVGVQIFSVLLQNITFSVYIIDYRYEETVSFRLQIRISKENIRKYTDNRD